MLDSLDEIDVEIEQPSQEADHDQQVLLAMREVCARALGLVERSLELGDVVAQRAEALAGDLLADEVADQQAQERLALQRREGDRRPRVLDERRAALVGQRVDGALARLPGSLRASR